VPKPGLRLLHRKKEIGSSTQNDPIAGRLRPSRTFTPVRTQRAKPRLAVASKSARRRRGNHVFARLRDRHFSVTSPWAALSLALTDWRRERDLNPRRACTRGCFQDSCHQPDSAIPPRDFEYESYLHRRRGQASRRGSTALVQQSSLHERPLRRFLRAASHPNEQRRSARQRDRPSRAPYACTAATTVIGSHNRVPARGWSAWLLAVKLLCPR
jgi:hypothetical protein